MATSQSVNDWQQHRDPPNMWPTLAGLSILFHIGILGVAFPLVVRLTQSDTTAEADVTVPVELIEVSSEDVSTVPPSTSSPTTDNSSAPTTPRETTPPSAVSDAQPNSTAFNPAAPPRSETNPRNSAPQPPASQTTPRPTDQPTPRSTTPPNRPTSPQRSATAPTPNPQTTPQPTPQPTAQPTPQPTAQPTPQPSPQPAPQPTTPPQQSTPPEPPTLPSGTPLEPPPEIASATRDAVFVNLVSLTQVSQDTPGDWPDEPPDLLKSPSDSIVLNAGDHDCGDLGGLPNQRVSMQVVISANGSISRAWPWPNRPGTEFEQYVACLMPKTDFRFTPARQGTQNVATDRMILNIEIGPG